MFDDEVAYININLGSWMWFFQIKQEFLIVINFHTNIQFFQMFYGVLITPIWV